MAERYFVDSKFYFAFKQWVLYLDIEATINSIQIGTAADGGDAADIVNVIECPTESTDYQPEYETTESEVEAILQDSIEQFYSFSDTEDNWTIVTLFKIK